jgi:hypothetical protein
MDVLPSSKPLRVAPTNVVPYIDSQAGGSPEKPVALGREGPDLRELPPPVTESQFRDLEGATKEQVGKRAASFVSDLRSFLNQGSCLNDIQSIRRRWSPRSNARLAFEGGDFPADSEHWYIYNSGGRNEAQFNVGLFPDYLRIGLGFEFTKKMYGVPEEVQAAWGQFRSVVGQYRRGFERFAQEDFLQIEWRPSGTEGRAYLKYVSTPRVTRWLLRPRGADWIFIGRLLYRGKDAEILEDPVRLKEVMESVFGSFKPLWQQAQMGADV